jgi:Predicted nucleic-acid-binding protein, contains PIN domain
MGAEYFLDTNILVYSFDASAPGKASKARSLIEDSLITGHGAISWQVVQEFCNLALRKFTSPMTVTECSLYASKVLFPLCRVWPSDSLLSCALDLVDESGYSFFDCLIVAAALESGAERLYTEDLQDGRRIRGLIVENPFD